MAKKMKLDTARLKQLALEKGERVGLAAALLIMVVIAGYGLVKGLGAKSPAGEIHQKAQQLAMTIDKAGPPPEDHGTKPKDVPRYNWDPHYELAVSAPDWFDPGAAGDNARRNPEVLRVGDVVGEGEVKDVKVQYLEGGTRLYAFNENQGTLEKLKPSGAGSGPAVVAGVGQVVADAYARDLHPTRMVLVTTTFPLRDQIEAIRKALHLKDFADIQANLAEPKFLGLLVYRREILPDGKATEPVKLYDADERGHPVAMKDSQTRLLLTTADFDDDATRPYLNNMKPGLATPLPQFMVLSGYDNPDYPKIDLPGIVASEVDNNDASKPMRAPRPGGRGPKAKPGGPAPQPGGPRPRLPSLPQPGGSLPPGQAAPTDDRPNLASAGFVRLAELAKGTEKALADKLKGDFNLFDPEGGPNPTEMDPQALQAAAQAAQFNRPANAKDDPSGPEKLLVRFFDADVQPGKTYQYSVFVRMANPNYGKKQEVAYEALAEEKELVSAETVTPRITIPREYYVYVVDTPPKELASKAKGPKGTETLDVSSEKAAIQIHRWADSLNTADKQPYVVADWLIAERLLIHRGEKLERSSVEVELPKWNRLRGTSGDFDLASSGGNSRGGIGKRNRHVASIDFYPPDRSKAEVLVDFVGGKHRYSENQDPRNPGLTSDDDAAMELLVLRADGTLAVRTSREDADAQTPAGGERVRRYNVWKERISSLRPDNNQSKMPGQP